MYAYATSPGKEENEFKFRSVTCYTNSTVPRIHVNTPQLRNITCTLVATGVILRSLECTTNFSGRLFSPFGFFSFLFFFMRQEANRANAKELKSPRSVWFGSFCFVLFVRLQKREGGCGWLHGQEQERWLRLPPDGIWVPQTDRQLGRGLQIE